MVQKAKSVSRTATAAFDKMPLKRPAAAMAADEDEATVMKRPAAAAVAMKRPAAALENEVGQEVEESEEEEREEEASVMKKPAASKLQLKRPAAATESDGDLEADDDEGASVMKKPAASALQLKRPAAAIESNGDQEADEEEEEASMMKRPAAAALPLKRPAAVDENEDDQDAREDGGEEAAEKSQAQEARDAAKEVQKTQRLIDKLNAENEKILERIKQNRVLLRKKEKELEEKKEAAKKITRKLDDKLRKQIRKRMDGKANRAKDQAERLGEKLKAVRKRYNKLRLAAGKVKGRAGDVEMVYNRALRNFDEAKKLCARLKKEGEEVPEEGEKDLSAPGAYKPPGLRAAIQRDAAKAELAKAKERWERAAAPSAKKEERLKELRERMKEIQQKQEEVEESIKAAAKAGRSR